MGFFDDLKATAKTEMDGVKKNVKIAQLQSELNELKKEETNIYAKIGQTAVLDCGAESFGDDGEKLLAVQKKIAEKDEEISALKIGETNAEAKAADAPAKKVCPKCGAECGDDIKFCPMCGLRLEE